MLTFDAGDSLVGVFGATYDDGATRVFSNLGFWMSSGRQHGPFGGPLSRTYGTTFTNLGRVYSFYGSNDPNGYLSGLGTWTDSPSPPPAPPFRPPPPSPPPFGPSPPLALNLGKIQSTGYGDGSGTYWDDGAHDAILGFKIWLRWDQTAVQALQVIP